MNSKESTKNIKKPVENTNLSWEKEKELLARCDRESRLINQRKKK